MSEDRKPLVDGPPVEVSRATVAVVTAVVLSVLGSGSTVALLKPNDYVTPAQLELALERHSAKPHDVTAGLIGVEGRKHEDQAVERAVKEVNTRLETIERLLREQGDRTTAAVGDHESRLRSLESGRGVRGGVRGD